MKLVAITSCPTGIAHSQMAAENLEQSAEAAGHDISVEVQGAMGTEDELTAEEIEAADAAIVAADTSVSTDRFDDTPLVKGTVKDAVNDADGMLAEAVERAGSDSASATVESTPTADEPDETPKRRGGDPSKGLFARLKRLFS